MEHLNSQESFQPLVDGFLDSGMLFDEWLNMFIQSSIVVGIGGAGFAALGVLAFILGGSFIARR